MIDIEKLTSEIVFSAQRSRGPGGQNVNKTNSAAQIKWNYKLSTVISEYQKDLVTEKLASYINKEGDVYLRSDIFRDLESNKKEVVNRLAELLKHAFKREKPRLATKPTYSSKQRRHSDKKKRGEIKKGRSNKWD